MSGPTPEPSFQALILMLATQAMIDLGEIPSPMSGKAEIDLRKAGWHLELLKTLQRKTAGNLDEAEAQAIENVLREVETKWSEKSDQATS